MTLLAELLAANLPVISADESGAISMGPMDDAQQSTFANLLLQHFNRAAYTAMQANLTDIQTIKADAILSAANLGNWWTWTQAQFITWCDANLMTDSQVDAATLSAALKTNIKAINLFIRNAGKLVIVMRDVVKWIIKGMPQ